jgi:hypothetical protein
MLEILESKAPGILEQHTCTFGKEGSSTKSSLVTYCVSSCVHCALMRKGRKRESEHSWKERRRSKDGMAGT